MKRLTITLLTLLMSMGAWAKDEFPIELTCELGRYITFFHFDRTKELSWWTPHPSTESEGTWGTLFGNDNFKDKRNKLNLYDITDSTIIFEIKSRRLKFEFLINRYSLKVEASGRYTGRCYKGFKEYEKQI